jgi:endonuclease YncB( thermonuclease family)
MRSTVRCIALLTLLLLTLVLLFTTNIALAAAIGDQVAPQARNRAGVPLHQEPRGTHDFQLIPDGTRATVIDVAQDGRWLKLSLPDGRTGWVTSSYVHTLTVITPNQTKLRMRLFGIDAPETPKGNKFPGQPFGKDAEAYPKQLVEGKRVKVEIYQVDRYKRLLSTILLDGRDINLAMIEAGLAEVYRGPESGNPYKPQYQAAEDVARSAKKGMWVQGDNYERPRTYRKRVGIR